MSNSFMSFVGTTLWCNSPGLFGSHHWGETNQWRPWWWINYCSLDSFCTNSIMMKWTVVPFHQRLCFSNSPSLENIDHKILLLVNLNPGSLRYLQIFIRISPLTRTRSQVLKKVYSEQLDGSSVWRCQTWESRISETRTCQTLDSNRITDGLV